MKLEMTETTGSKVEKNDAFILVKIDVELSQLPVISRQHDFLVVLVILKKLFAILKYYEKYVFCRTASFWDAWPLNNVDKPREILMEDVTTNCANYENFCHIIYACWCLEMIYIFFLDVLMDNE